MNQVFVYPLCHADQGHCQRNMAMSDISWGPFYPHGLTVIPVLISIYMPSRVCGISDISIKVGDQSISPSDDPPRNLGVIFNSTCCLDAHIAKLCRNINFNLYSVGKIRKYLDGPTAEKMINATVTSRLDYCNSLLYGAKQSHIDRLQCCQNNAARIISKGASLTILALCWKNCIG